MLLGTTKTSVGGVAFWDRAFPHFFRWFPKMETQSRVKKHLLPQTNYQLWQRLLALIHVLVQNNSVVLLKKMHPDIFV